MGRMKPRLAGASPEIWLFGLFALWSAVPLFVLYGSLDGGPHFVDRGVFNGSYGLQVPDHLQYLAWVRDSGENVAFANQFDVVEDPHLFFHPMLWLSGVAWLLGASVQLAYVAWAPVTVVTLFVGFAAYVRRLVSGPGERFAALFLALFFFTPVAYLVDWLDVGDATLEFGSVVMSLEMFAGAYAWGGFPGTISIALMPLALIGIERVLAEAPRRPGWSQRTYAWVTGLAGLLCTWFHPWQGLTILMMVAGLAAWGRFDRRYLALAVPVALTAAPILYYFVLSHTDSSWAFAAEDRDYSHVGTWLYLGLAPALLALPGFRGPAEDDQERLLRLWPLAALAVYFVLQQSWFYHAFIGLSLPLSILAVRGWRRLGVPRPLAVAAILAFTLPGLAWTADTLRDDLHNHFLTDDEGRALRYVEDSPREGPVLAVDAPLGLAAPAFTGRNTWVGHYTWTPDNGGRRARAGQLFDGRLSQQDALKLVGESTATFLVADCRSRADLRGTLRPVLIRARRFGCATVYEVRQAQSVAAASP